jgi:hypothetical protein
MLDRRANGERRFGNVEKCGPDAQRLARRDPVMEGESLDSSGRQSTQSRRRPRNVGEGIRLSAFVRAAAIVAARPVVAHRIGLQRTEGLPPDGGAEVDALRAALDELVERHESLRTRFGFEESGPVQVIAAQLRIGLEVED